MAHGGGLRVGDGVQIFANAVVAGAVSYHCWRRLHDQDPTTGRRASWLAIAGMMSSGLFFLMIAASYLPLVFLAPCRQPG